MPGMSEFLGGIGKILDKLPIQGRRERWRNEIDNLKKEKNGLQKKPATFKTAKRMASIDKRIDYLEQLCKNAEKD